MGHETKASGHEIKARGHAPLYQPPFKEAINLI